MAERELTAGVLSAIAAGTVRPVIFFEGEYVSGGAAAFLRLFTGVGQLAWDGKTWTGGRELLGISAIQETTNLQAVGFAVRVSGLDAAKLSIALQSMRKNKPGRLWLGFFDAAGALIADPYPLRRGRFDIAPIERSGETMTIEARYEDRLVRLEIPNERRYTSEDQQREFPDDKGFDMVPKLVDLTGAWAPPRYWFS
jgi:hypothetical protein